MPQKKEYNKGHAKKPVYQKQSLEFQEAHITTQIYKWNLNKLYMGSHIQATKNASQNDSQSEDTHFMLSPHLIKHLLCTETEISEMGPTKDLSKMLEPSVTTSIIELKLIPLLSRDWATRKLEWKQALPPK